MSVGAAGPLVVTYPLSERSRAIVTEELGGAAPGGRPQGLPDWPFLKRLCAGGLPKPTS
jgi:hypothetical protein